MLKLAAITVDGEPRLAFVEGERFRLLPRSMPDIQAAIVQGAEALERLAAEAGLETIGFDERLLRAPRTGTQRDILCAGWNYWDHFEEGRGRRDGQEVERPEHPTFFTKGPETMIGPLDPVAFDDRISQKWDYEVEVALIIGKDGRNIPEEQALDHVFGYCLANDISQRDLQRAHGGQWLKGKSIDGTMPFGPYVTLAKGVDPAAIEIECVLNGETVQSASTQLMAFSVARLIAELSFGMTLRAGDVLLTGTPAGVGNARTPPLFLKDGDEVVCRSAQLGVLRNRISRMDLSTPTAR
ncbi:fumarylacetoacetate hydrolase family protein [Nitratireductor pacificus]|uniref:5-carboxymethyl-2-hydroxymuconate delta-isomerase n=1 Tax=Nitratireductor pacificus pht-3B TaxID=391937 RepID=K2N8M6_9HYPH|nr:fumarylacetoacetate hydrolase family protein [Nitratireductor pacificus]EKF20463.1 5-carboxymethyl-2-hydroxymuconate delta-isomerase [Nitratireductor pacificus pht-3B]